MYPAQFDKLLELVKPKLLKRSRRPALPPEMRLAMTLKYLAHGGSFVNLCFEFRVGHSTASKTIRETCEAIWEVLHTEYFKRSTDQDWLNISEEFWTRWNFPNTLGAIDGKHVAVQCPTNSGSLYYNYKKYYSIVLLACCDADYKFTWVDIGAYGSENDAGIFKRSQIKIDMETVSSSLPEGELNGSSAKVPYYFVGDEAFPLNHYLLRPYPGSGLTNERLIFNYRLSRARRTIENSFGILASRWRVYRQPLLCSVETSEAIIKATVCLHNFLKINISDKYAPPTLTDVVLNNGEVVEGKWREIVSNDKNLTRVGRIGANVSSKKAYSQRDIVAKYLLTPEGSVPWQMKYINRGK
ncbi:hypothetical protein PPYR_15286 [Photinus pyralis]|uniref:DDE Tnp4 domain-containing protein n=1 Tax=Photinus pyralis TaxID=7054 RepID=A0A5N3ZZ52_PHOPY|nr:hypothetical protein PPYR_15286 [Photinus pyralis]